MGKSSVSWSTWPVPAALQIRNTKKILKKEKYSTAGGAVEGGLKKNKYTALPKCSPASPVAAAASEPGQILFSIYRTYKKPTSTNT